MVVYLKDCAGTRSLDSSVCTTRPLRSIFTFHHIMYVPYGNAVVAYSIPRQMLSRCDRSAKDDRTLATCWERVSQETGLAFVSTRANGTPPYHHFKKKSISLCVVYQVDSYFFFFMPSSILDGYIVGPSWPSVSGRFTATTRRSGAVSRWVFPFRRVAVSHAT